MAGVVFRFAVGAVGVLGIVARIRAVVVSTGTTDVALSFACTCDMAPFLATDASYGFLFVLARV